MTDLADLSAAALVEAYRTRSLQIIGQAFDDLGVLPLSHAYEEMRAPSRPWPVLAG